MRLKLTSLAALALLGAAACQPSGKPPLSPGEVRAVRVDKLPASPEDAAWQKIPIHEAQLMPQDVVEPRLMSPAAATVGVQAVTDGKLVAFRLSWAEQTRSDIHGAGGFSDACAVQLPSVTGPEAPSPLMGEAGRPVEITYWRASWQATVDGRPDDIHAFYPSARVDHYPFESASLTPGSPEQVAMAQRYAPARALGNNMAGPREQPVQDLVAEGPGTLRTAPKAVSTGSGKPTQQGWAVVLARPLPNGVRPGTRSQVAFAVWQGARGEVGARKMRSPWIPLAVEGKP